MKKPAKVEWTIVGKMRGKTSISLRSSPTRPSIISTDSQNAMASTFGLGTQMEKTTISPTSNRRHRCFLTLAVFLCSLLCVCYRRKNFCFGLFYGGKSFFWYEEGKMCYIFRLFPKFFHRQWRGGQWRPGLEVIYEATDADKSGKMAKHLSVYHTSIMESLINNFSISSGRFTSFSFDFWWLDGGQLLR
jgi:hypothetical protein